MKNIYKNLNFFLLFLFAIFLSCSERIIISTGSMEPTFQIGDILKLKPIKNHTIQKGDIVLYYGKDGKKYCHRCIAIENDILNIKNCSVFLNNKKLDESYVSGCTSYNFYPNKLHIEGKVPVGFIVVLGDNRENSADSRLRGYISVSKVIGRVEKDLD